MYLAWAAPTETWWYSFTPGRHRRQERALNTTPGTNHRAQADPRHHGRIRRPRLGGRPDAGVHPAGRKRRSVPLPPRHVGVPEIACVTC